VRLEDNLHLGRGQLAPSNADQVAKTRRILEELSLDVASPDEARRTLGTKGPDRMAFYDKAGLPGRLTTARPKANRQVLLARRSNGVPRKFTGIQAYAFL
jgi:hypothetical protein